MTKQEIIEGNRIIAEFMQIEDKEEVLDKSSSYFKYHLSWEWLMPLVEKIESLGYTISIKRFTTRILKNKQTYLTISCDNKIESTYLACIIFIKK